MEAKDYSIVSPSGNFANDSENAIYNLKLTDDLVKKIMKGQKDLNNLSGIEFNISDNKLTIGTEVVHFMKVKESQPLHLLLNPSEKSSNLEFLGTVTQKFNPKLELEASKAEAIRQRSQEAEKERLARKTVELDGASLPVNGIKGQKRLIKRRPSVSSSITSSNSTRRSETPTFTPTVTPPETPETPSPKKHQIYSTNFTAASLSNKASVPSSAKKPSNAKDRLSAIMKRRR